MMQHLLTCQCGSKPDPMEPTQLHHGYMLQCPWCDEGTYRFGKSPEECAEAWNDWCEENYPAEFTDAMVTRMRRGLMTFEEAQQQAAQPTAETFPEYEGQGSGFT